MIKHEVAFIDNDVDDLDILLAGLRPDVDAILLSATESAPRQMARALAQHPHWSTVHVIAHGAPGRVAFTSGDLSLASLSDHAADLDLTDRNLQLWSCETAAGDAGQRFVAALAKATGARVSASTQRVGGGDWTLDSADENAASPLTEDAARAYQGVLVAKAFNGGSGTYTWSTSGSSWSPTGVPAAGDTVTIGTGSGLRTINLDVDTAALGSLTFTQSNVQFNVGNHALNVNSTSASGITLQAGTLSVAGGTINVGASGAVVLASGGTSTGSGSADPVLTGYGKVSGAVTASGTSGHTDTVTATGGTLEITGAVTKPGAGALALNIGANATDKLLLDGASAASSATFAGASGTLEVNTGGSLTLSSALAIGTSTLKLDGAGTTQFTDTAGVTISGGSITGTGTISATTAITGAGTISIPLSTAATLTASGGTLDLTGAISAAASLHIANVNGSVLKLDGAVGTASVHPIITFDGANGGFGTLDLTGISLSSFQGVISGFGTGEGIKITGAASETLDATGKVLTVYNASSVALGTINLSTSYTGYAFSVTGGVISASDAPTILHIGGADHIVSGQSGDSVVTGTAIANSTVTIKSGATTLGSATADASGAWSYTLTSANLTTLGQGSAKTITATDTHSGITSTATTSFSFTVDTAAPTIVISSVTGDNIINQSEAAAGFVISGTAADTTSGVTGQTATITLYNSSNVLIGTYTSTVTAGAWSVTVPSGTSSALSDGSYTVNANITDVAGNAASQVTQTITVDKAPPAAPSITSVTDNVGVIQGTLVSGATTDDTAPTVRVSLTGTGAVAGNTVYLYNNNTALTGGSVSLSSANISAGYVDITPSTALTNGSSYALNARISDSAGNISNGSSAFNVTIDTTPPSALATVTAINADSGALSTDFITNTAAQTVSGTFSGSLSAGDTIQVSANGGTTWITATTSGSTWTASGVTLSAGAGTLTVRTLDTAGNVATGSSHAYTLDTTAPTVAITAVATDNIINAAEAAAGVTVTGSASDGTGSGVNGQTVTVSLVNGSNVVIGTATGTVAAGAWTVNIPSALMAGLADGSYSVRADLTDIAGNAATQASKAVTVDQTPPLAPSITSVTDNAGAITGLLTSGATTDDTTPTVRVSISGTGAAAGDKVSLYNGATLLTGTTVTLSSLNISNGYVDITPSTGLTNGSTYALDAKTTDASGNLSGASSGFNLTIDTTAPTATATITTLSADTGTSATDFITNTAAQTVSGTFTGSLGAGEAIQVSADGGTTWITASTSGATWTASGVTLSSGANSLSVRAIDPAGNVKTGTSHSYTLDTTGPNLTITAVSGDNYINAAESAANVPITGAVTDSGGAGVTGQTVSVTITDSTNAVIGTYTGTLSGSTWSATIPAATASTLANGSYTATATIADKAGNSSVTSQIFTVNKTAPNAPSIVSVSDNVGSVQGALTSGDTTDDTTPTVRVGLTGTSAAAGDSVQLYNSGSALSGGSVVLSAADITAGYIDVTPNALASGASYVITAKVINAAGNASGASGSFSLTELGITANTWQGVSGGFGRTTWSGNWTDTTHWSAGHVPTSSETAVFPAGSGAYTVTLTGAATAGSVQFTSGNATLAVGSYSFATNGASFGLDMSVGGHITLAGGSVGSPGGLSLGATATIVGYGSLNNAITGTGTITSSGGTLKLNGIVNGANIALDTATSSTLEIAGTVTTASTPDISNANQILQIDSGATLNLTSGSTVSVAAGTLKMAGGTFSNPTTPGNPGLYIQSGGYMSGFGTVATDLYLSSSKLNTVTATGGVLEFTGSVTGPGSGNNWPGPTFVIDSSVASTLKFSGPVVGLSQPIVINSANQTLEIGPNGDLTIDVSQSATGSEDVTNGHIVLDGGTLSTYAGTLVIDTGASLTGWGTVNADLDPGAASGLITAKGGVLNFNGVVAGGNTFAIDSAAPATLMFSDTASINPVAISSHNQTLEVGATAVVTITGGAESITNGTIKLDGGQIIDSAGFTVGAGAAVTGLGTVTGAITLAGGSITESLGQLFLGSVSGYGDIYGSPSATSYAVVGSGKALEFHASIDTDNAANFTIGAGGTLKFDGAVGAGSGPVITFSPGASLLDLSGTTLGVFKAQLSGFASLEQIKVANAASAFLDSSGKVLTVLDAGGHSIGTLNFASSYVGDLFTVNPATGIITEGLDPITPSLSSVSDNTGSPNVVAGVPTTITLHFNEAVLAIPGTTIELSNSDQAVLSGGNGTKDLSFTYTPSGTTSVFPGLTVTKIYYGSITYADGTPVPTNTFGEIICFMAGTHVRTPIGEVNVEDLSIGDLVLTSDGAIAPIRWIGRQTVSRMFADPLKVDPVRIRAGALSDNMPARDLLVSPDHALLVDGVLVHAGALVNGVSILRDNTAPMTYVYYHVELDDHSLILAEGVPAETFIDHVERMAFDNWQEHEALYPQGRQIVEMAYPRAKAYRQVPQKLRNRLMARATERFGSVMAGVA